MMLKVTGLSKIFGGLKELEVVGACNDQERLDDAIALLGDPALGLADIVTHRFTIEQYQEAFALAESRVDGALKPAIVFG